MCFILTPVRLLPGAKVSSLSKIKTWKDLFHHQAVLWQARSFFSMPLSGRDRKNILGVCPTQQTIWHHRKALISWHYYSWDNN